MMSAAGFENTLKYWIILRNDLLFLSVIVFYIMVMYF